MSNVILQNNPKANYLAHKKEIDLAIKRTLNSGRYILGEQVLLFEKEFASFIGVSEAIGVSSGTDALYLALKACSIGYGDAVITVSHTAVATVAAIELAGVSPVLLDIDPKNYTMDPESLKKVIQCILKRKKQRFKYRLKGIIPVHLYGHPASMPAIMKIAKEYNLYVIEDCAQSHGAAIGGQKTGTWGDISAFSFYPTKNLGALGDAGALVTNDANIGRKVRILREYGWHKRYISNEKGMNARLDELQAAILRVKLRYLEEDNIRRREIAKIYDNLLPQESIIIPKVNSGVKHAYHQYVIRSLHRDDLQSFLKINKIETSIHYPLPIHLQPAYRNQIAIAARHLPHTEVVSREILSLPMYPQLSEEQLQRICSIITKWSRTRKNR